MCMECLALGPEVTTYGYSCIDTRMLVSEWLPSVHALTVSSNQYVGFSGQLSLELCGHMW
jgi:hypothetical protein